MQAVIFDMDGTLFQTNKILALSLEDTFQYLRSINQWDGEAPIAQYREIMGVPLPKVWEALLPDHSMEVRERTDAHFLKRLIVNINDGKGELYPNVKEVFSSLKENQCAIYIASNGLSDYLEAIVRHYGLDHWVTETFSIQRVDSLKKSDLVQKIAEKYELTDAVVVGDRLSDINAAKDNGFVSIGCHFDFAKEEEFDQADRVIHNLNELTMVLTELNLAGIKG
ncbi:adenosylhomocysteine nucleosidase [Bacillus sp. es.036]|nr:adenosylhomocysteine nucleosidase [Bacillus sp. es.036]